MVYTSSYIVSYNTSSSPPHLLARAGLTRSLSEAAARLRAFRHRSGVLGRRRPAQWAELVGEHRDGERGPNGVVEVQREVRHGSLRTSTSKEVGGPILLSSI